MRSLKNWVFLLLGVCPAVLEAQSTPTCQITAVPTIVRSEGVAERVGDIVFSCTGRPGGEITGNLNVQINTFITNRSLGNDSLDVTLSVNGVQANVPATRAGASQVTWSGLRIVFPTSGQVEMRIANLRADASLGGGGATPPQAPFPGFAQQIVAQLAFNPGGLLNFTSTNFTLATVQTGLFATVLGTLIPGQFGSPLPEEVTFPSLISRETFFASTRFTEGFQSAFLPRQAGEDQGTRLMLRFRGFPAAARLFVPAALAGSNADIPTAAGDFGGGVSGGRYLPGSRTLLLSRVSLPDASGGAGFPVTVQATGPGDTFVTMTEVTLVNGEGTAVYEVIDSDPTRIESVQLPVFIGVARSGTATNTTMNVEASFAPVTLASGTTGTGPVPRFRPRAAETDCGAFRDCGDYIPKLGAPPINTDFTLVRGAGVEMRTIPLSNEGGGFILPWTARVQYRNGSDWILLDPVAGLEPVLIRMYVRSLPQMAAGLYEANVIIDAGPYGVANYPVRLRVVEPQEPARPQPRVSSVQNGATFESGVVARGSIVTLRGANFAGENVSVTIDGKPARVLFSSAEQLNVLVPSDITTNRAQVVVTASGVASAPFMVEVGLVNPGIFRPGILNHDGSVNSANNPANTGSFVQIFATGLLPGDNSSTQIEARLHDQTYTSLPYAGPAPGIPGVQQVNLQIPAGWPTMMTEVLLCTTAGGQRVCSAPVQIHIRQVQQ